MNFTMRGMGADSSEAICSARLSMPITDLPMSSAMFHTSRSTEFVQPLRSRYDVQREKKAYH